MDAAIQPIVAALRQRASERPFALAVEFWNGHHETFGDAPGVTLKLNRPESARHLLQPDLGRLAQAYVEGDIDLGGPSGEAVRLAAEIARGTPQRTRWLPRLPWQRKHGLASDAKAIAHHYDVSNEFYRLWLDREMVYSCACFREGIESLDAAQMKKLDLVCRKLQLQPGDRFLDIGCGWGALLVWARRYYGVKAVGVTLSRQQYEFARQRIQDEGLADDIEVRLQDYREIPEVERFDKIASVGMFEHVGLKNLPTYFGAIFRLLRPGGLVLNHGITSRSTVDDPVRAGGGDFIDRYVFPDGELPTVGHAVGEMESQGLEVFDVEGLRPHYARTLQHWVARLEHRRDEAVALVGEQRYRVWRIYMAGCAHAFEHAWISIHQLLAARPGEHGESVQPWNRSYMLQP